MAIGDRSERGSPALTRNGMGAPFFGRLYFAKCTSQGGAVDLFLAAATRTLTSRDSAAKAYRAKVTA